MGRKAISGTRKTDRPLRIRLTDGERRRIDDAARAEGKPTSSWAREILMKAAEPPAAS
jgi:uncharacterized protein (DUF1778 family)